MMSALGFDPISFRPFTHSPITFNPTSDGPTIETIEIDVQPSSWVVGPRDRINGHVGGTATDAFVLIPSNNGGISVLAYIDHAGSGANPRLVRPEFSEYQVVRVELPDRINYTAAEVAEIFADTINSETLHDAVVVNGSTVQISGYLDASACTLGTPWDSRGESGRWGIGSTRAEDGHEGPIPGILAAHLVSPSNNIYVRALVIQIGSIVDTSDRWRACVYVGGNSDSYVGADLLYDFGQIPASQIVANSHAILFADRDNPLFIRANSNVWIVLKGTADITYIYGYLTGADAPLLGQMTAQAFRSSTGGMSLDPTVPFEPVASGTSTPDVPFIPAVELIYDRGVRVGDGSWRRNWGIHNPDIPTTGTEVGLNSTVYMGGSLPNVLGRRMRRAAMAVGAAASLPNFRVGIFGGGSAGSAVDAVELHDFGQIPGTPVNELVWLELGEEEPDIDLEDVLRAWLAFRNNSLGAMRVRFVSIGNPEIADPPWNPMDFPRTGTGDNPEFETFATNTNHSTDPTQPFESPVVGHVSDDTPGNYPMVQIELRTPPFVIRVV